MKNFRFYQTSGIDNFVFDRSLREFFELSIDGTIKEDIQNSLDAQLNPEIPVGIEIRLLEVPRNEIPGIDGIFGRLSSIEKKQSTLNEETRNSIKHMMKYKDVPIVKVLTFEDKNTKGLSGVDKHSNSDSIFASYAYQKGIHIETEVKIEQSRGGSHGVGKIANNAASALNMMFFANCDEKKEKHVGGNIHLIEHNYKGKCFKSTGFFTDEENGIFYPYENYGLSSIFSKDTRGLKVIIPFLHDEFFDATRIIKCVCDNFFMAILNNRLIVSIFDEKGNQEIINKDSIHGIIYNNKIYQSELETRHDIDTFLYLETLQDVSPRKFAITLKTGEIMEFDLYLRKVDDITKGKMAIIRSMGMKIEDFKVKNNVKKPFNAVLLCGSKEDKYLKSLENESHTQISHEHIKDNVMRKNAMYFINKIHSEMQKIITEIFQAGILDEDVINTDDLINTFDSSFKKEITKNSDTFIVDGKSLVKLKPRGEKSKPKKPREGGPAKEVKNRNPSNNMDGEKDKIISASIVVPTYNAKRIILKDYERLQFVLDGDFKKYRLADIKFILIDGMGKEIKNGISLEESFNRIELEDGTKLLIENNKIINVPLRKKVLELKLFFNEGYNNAYKFVYEMEVSK